MYTAINVIVALSALGIIVLISMGFPMLLDALRIEFQSRCFRKDVLSMFPTLISEENLRVVAKKRRLYEAHVLWSLDVLIANLLTEKNIDENSSSPEAKALKLLKTIRQKYEHNLPLIGLPAELRFYIMKVRDALSNKSEELLAPFVEQLVINQAAERHKKYVAILFGSLSFLLAVIEFDWTRVDSWFCAYPVVTLLAQ